jgi:hypothetical protein
MDEDDAGALRGLLDRERVAAVINQLFVATDQRDWPRVAACLAPVVTFDMASVGGGPAMQLTPQQITAGWEAGLAPIDAVHHQTGNFSIECGEAEADAACYGVAYHYRRTSSGKDTRVFVGSYDVHLRRLEGAWKIDLFRFNLKFIEGNRELEKDPVA